MRSGYAIYKGLQKPLTYRGFKGKFIYWGVGSLVSGLIGGGLLGAFTNMYLGLTTTIIIIGSGLTFTFFRQKNGLHSKIRHTGIFIHPVNLKISYAKRKENSV